MQMAHRTYIDEKLARTAASHHRSARSFQAEKARSISGSSRLKNADRRTGGTTTQAKKWSQVSSAPHLGQRTDGRPPWSRPTRGRRPERTWSTNACRLYGNRRSSRSGRQPPPGVCHTVPVCRPAAWQHLFAPPGRSLLACPGKQGLHECLDGRANVCIHKGQHYAGPIRRQVPDSLPGLKRASSSFWTFVKCESAPSPSVTTITTAGPCSSHCASTRLSAASIATLSAR